MISQLPLRASENNTLELFSQMQLSPALLRRYRQSLCPHQKLRPVDNVSPYSITLHGHARVHAPDPKGETVSGDAHVR